MHFYFVLFMVIVGAQGSFVKLEGQFHTSNGGMISEIHVATQVTTCTREVMLKYRPTSSSGFIQGFLTRGLNIVPKSTKTACPSYTEIYILNSQFTIKRVGTYVIVSTKTTTSSSTLRATSLAPLTTTASQTCQRSTGIDLSALFDEVNDFVIAGLTVFATSAFFYIRGMLVIAIRALIAAFASNKKQQIDDIDKQDTRQTSSDDSNSGTNNGGGGGGHSGGCNNSGANSGGCASNSVITSNSGNSGGGTSNSGGCTSNSGGNQIGFRDVGGDYGTSSTINENNCILHLPRHSSLTTINEISRNGEGRGRALRRQNSHYGNITLDDSSNNESPPPRYQAPTASQTTTKLIFCKCSTGSCVDCKCAKAKVRCNIMCHKNTKNNCLNPFNKN